jgi:hypothetical protein
MFLDNLGNNQAFSEGSWNFSGIVIYFLHTRPSVY